MSITNITPDLTEAAAELTDDERAASDALATLLSGGFASEAVTVRATLNGRPVAVVAAVHPSEDGDGSFDVIPAAVLIDDELFEALTPV